MNPPATATPTPPPPIRLEVLPVCSKIDLESLGSAISQLLAQSQLGSVSQAQVLPAGLSHRLVITVHRSSTTDIDFMFDEISRHFAGDICSIDTV